MLIESDMTYWVDNFVWKTLAANRRWDECICEDAEHLVTRIIERTWPDRIPYEHDDRGLFNYTFDELQWYKNASAATLPRYKDTPEDREKRILKYGDSLVRAEEFFCKRFKIAYFADVLTNFSVYQWYNDPTYIEHPELFWAVTEHAIIRTMWHERRHIIQETLPGMVKLLDRCANNNAPDPYEADAIHWSYLQMKRQLELEGDRL